MNTIVQVEGLEQLNAALDILPGKAKYATALGMNRTMDEAQTTIRQGLSQKFTLRRATFMERTIYRKPGEDWATKTKLEARVRINEERNHLAKFEDGGQKLPTRGRKMLAVPVEVRRTGAGIVPRSMSPRALLAKGNAYVRDGKLWLLSGRGKMKKRTLAYVFKRSTPIAPVLGFVATATEVIGRRALPNIVGAIEVELARGLTTRSGPSSVS